MPPLTGKKKKNSSKDTARQLDARSGQKSVVASRNRQAEDENASSKHEQKLPFSVQQSILNVFANAFPSLTQSISHLTRVTQEVKTHLYNREFATAFSKPDYLQAYALRWSAARALGYTDIFLKPERRHWLISGQQSSRLSSESPQHNRLPQKADGKQQSPSNLTNEHQFSHSSSLTSTKAGEVLVTDVDQPGSNFNGSPDLLQYNSENVIVQAPATQGSTTKSTVDVLSSTFLQPPASLEPTTQTGPSQHNALQGSSRLTHPSGVAYPTRDFTKIICIGGGAGAEVTALAAAFSILNRDHEQTHDLRGKPSESDNDDHRQDRDRPDQAGLHITAIDIADWAKPLEAITMSLSTPPSVSPYASEAVKSQNRALLSNAEDFKVSFHELDVLQWAGEDQNDETPAITGVTNERLIVTGNTSPPFHETVNQASLITIMFTLNELFSTSIARTTAFLLHLTDAMHLGARLVVVDSPGSYSEITIGRAETVSADPSSKDLQPIPKANVTKKYPMKWLLDHTLLDVAGGELGSNSAGDVRRHGKTMDGPKWVKEETEDSVWFRHGLDQQVKIRYPIELENMRYQIHVYRRV